MVSTDEEVEEAIRLIRHGTTIGLSLVDKERPSGEGLLFALARHRQEVGHGKWRDEDFVFQFEALRGLLGVGAAQISGLATLLHTKTGLLLHPSMTLVRSLAEACGVVVWMLEPLIVPVDEDGELAHSEWVQSVSPVPSRFQLVMLNAIADREHRYRAERKDLEADKALLRLQEQRDRIADASPKANTTLEGKRTGWTIDGQRLPKKTDLAIKATEYSYGQQHVGTGMNPYPMLSGYAHASLDVVFAYGTSQEKPALSTLYQALPEETKLISSLGLRLYSVMLDVTINAIGESRSEFESWDREVEAYVVGA